MRDLLQHRIGYAIGEIIARQKQNRQSIDGRHPCTRNHIKRPRTNRSRAGKGGEPIAMFGERRRNMHHSLLMLRPVELQPLFFGKLHDSLPQPRYIAVTKYTPNSLDKAVLATIPLYILLCNEADQCLTHRKTNRVTHKNKQFYAPKTSSAF